MAGQRQRAGDGVDGSDRRQGSLPAHQPIAWLWKLLSVRIGCAAERARGREELEACSNIDTESPTDRRGGLQMGEET